MLSIKDLYPYLLLAFFFPSILLAQTPSIIWQQQYGGTGDDRMNDLLNLTDGGYIAAGFTTSSDGDISVNNGGQDAWVLRMDAAGGLLWEVAIGGSDKDVFNAIEATSDGGFLLLGTSFSSESELGTAKGESDIWLVKISGKGEIIWSKLFGGSGQDVGIDLTAMGEGRYAIGGYTFSEDGDFAGENRGDRDACLLVVDEMGALAWVKTYGGSDEEIFNAVKFEIQSGQIIAVGFTRSEDGDVQDNKGFSDFWLLKLNAETGKIEGEHTYGGTSSDKGIAAVLLPNGELAILGETLSSNGQVTDYQGQGDLWLVKIAGDGSLIWQKTLGSGIIETAYNLLQLQNGDLVVLGASLSLAQPSTLSDVLLFKVAAQNGEVIWEKHISGSGDDVGNGLARASTGGFCFAGHTDSMDGDIGEGGKVHGSHKAWIVQVDDGSTDIEAWQQTPSMDLQVFPNPIEGNRFYIEIVGKELDGSEEFALYNILGERLKVKKLEKNKQGLHLEVENWSADVYFLKVCKEGGCGFSKIQKI